MAKKALGKPCLFCFTLRHISTQDARGWRKDGSSYDNATKMFNIKSLRYKRINCEPFLKLWSEKCKMLCDIPLYSGYHGN